MRYKLQRVNRHTEERCDIAFTDSKDDMSWLVHHCGRLYQSKWLFNVVDTETEEEFGMVGPHLSEYDEMTSGKTQCNDNA